MSSIIWKTESGRKRLDECYDRFTAKLEGNVCSRKIETRFGETNVMVTGPEDGAPLICLHAMRTGAPFLLSELKPLAREFLIYAPDMPGQSIRGPNIKLSLRDSSYADWMADVMDGLGLGTAGMFGVSWGGFVARRIAGLYPERVSRLALMVPAGIANGSHLKGLTKMAFPLLRYKFRPSEANLKALLAPIFTTWDADWAGFFACALRDWKMDMRIPPIASDEELARLGVSVLVLAAENDISFPGQAVIERVQRLVPKAETELLPGSMHCPPTTDEFREWLGNRLGRFFREDSTLRS